VEVSAKSAGLQAVPTALEYSARIALPVTEDWENHMIDHRTLTNERAELELVRVAASPDAMLNNAAVSPRGRVFSSFPRWSEQPTPGVAEAMQDGTFRPYPGGAWNSWAPGSSPEQGFVAVHSLHADRTNHLWVVDDAAPFHARYVAGGPKVVDIDLDSDMVVQVYPIPPEFLPTGAVLGHVRVDANYIYVTESGVGAIIVIERQSGRARRVLAGHPKMLADPRIVPLIDGREFRQTSGKVPVVNASLIELSADGEWLYFNCLLGPVLRRVPVERLLNEKISDETIGNTIEDIVRIPPCAGIARDHSGNLYLSSFTDSSILRLHRKELEVVACHPRIAFPNESSVGLDNWFYVPASQANRIGLYQPDGIPTVKRPWEVLKFPLPK
jgi:hypothetical protein